MVDQGKESLHGSTALLFLLNLDGASWTAGQGRGVLVGGYDLYLFPL